MHTSDTWICVADGGRAQFFHCDGPGREVEPVLGYNLASSRPMSSRHAVECGPAEWQTHFCGTIAERLDSAAANHLFEHLVLVAPPSILGELHNRISGVTLDLVVGEVNRDLTHATPREVACHLAGMLPQ
jgi:protein required for attachment to host cells